MIAAILLLKTHWTGIFKKLGTHKVKHSRRITVTSLLLVEIETRILKTGWKVDSAELQCLQGKQETLTHP